MGKLARMLEKKRRKRLEQIPFTDEFFAKARAGRKKIPSISTLNRRLKTLEEKRSLTFDKQRAILEKFRKTNNLLSKMSNISLEGFLVGGLRRKGIRTVPTLKKKYVEEEKRRFKIVDVMSKIMRLKGLKRR